MTDLPPGWAETTLGEILLRIEAGKSPRCEPRPARPDEWGIIKVSAMTWGEFRQEENKAVPSHVAVDPSYEIKPGDILVSRANTEAYVGAPVLVGACRPRLLLSDKSLRLVPSPHIDRRWLSYLLSSPEVRGEISRRATGTKDSMRNISQEALREIRIRVPPLPEQSRIIAILEDQLSHLQQGQMQLSRSLRRMRSLRRSVLHHYCRREGNSGGWRRVKIGNLGRVSTGSTPSAKESQYWGGEHSFITPGDLGYGEKITSVKRGLTDLGASASRTLYPGAVLTVCIGATIGKVGWVDEICSTNQQINAIQPNLSLYDSRFIAFALSAPELNAKLHSEASSTTLPILNKSRFQEIEKDIPELDEQERCVKFIEEVESSIRRLQGAVADSRLRAEQLWNVTLATAFSGHFMLRDPNDEPAAALLERIRVERAAAPLRVRRKNYPSSQKETLL